MAGVAGYTFDMAWLACWSGQDQDSQTQATSVGELSRWADVSARSECWFEVVHYVSLSRSRCGEVLIGMMGQFRISCTDWMYQFGDDFPAALVTQKPHWGSPTLLLVSGCSKGGGAALLMWLDYQRVGQPECLTGVGWPYQQAGQPGHVRFDGFDNPAVVLESVEVPGRWWMYLGPVTACIGVGDGGRGRAVAPQIRAKTIFSGKNRVKFGHFVNFFGHISCKIRAFC